MLSRCPKSLPCLLSSQCSRFVLQPILKTVSKPIIVPPIIVPPIIVPPINRPIGFPPLSLAKNPDEAIRITNLVAKAGGAYPADKIRVMLRECSVLRNKEMATQWGDALRLIFSKDMRNTSRKVLQDEYEYASMAAGPMYEPPGPSVYRLGILLDVAPNILVNYTHALVCHGYV